MIVCLYEDFLTQSIFYSITDSAPLVAVIREEGSNGDREMIAALYMAGFQVWDVAMQDIVSRKLTLDRFRGIVFPGGFSYAGK
jgi:phosphoribosylformylglycinamidine synthase